MGMLNEARKEKSKSASDKEHLKPDPKRKHKEAKPSSQMTSDSPGTTSAADDQDDQPEGGEVGADADAAGGDDSQPQQQDPTADESQPDPSDAQGPTGAQDQGGDDSGEAGPDNDEPTDPSDGGQGQDQGDDSGSAQGGPPAQGDDGSADPDSASGAGAGQPQTPGGGGPIDLTKVPISPALKEEFQRCNAALYTALYTNDKVANAVLKGIVPQGPHKIESVARASVLLMVQINKQLRFIQQMPTVVLPFMQDIVSHVIDLAMQVKKIPFTEQEAHAALGTAHELIMHTVGVTKKQVGGLQHVLPRSQIMDGLSKYKKHLAFIKGVQGPNTPGGAGGQPGTPGGQPGDQGAAPQGQPAGGPAPDASSSPQAGPAGASPQAGAPVTAAPGPGQSAPPGGMLSQAAAPQGSG